MSRGRAPRGRREAMAAAGALCHCGSHDVRGVRPVTGRIDRPLFRCGSCDATWTSGLRGKPYIRFVNVFENPQVGPGIVRDGPSKMPGPDFWRGIEGEAREHRRKQNAAAKRRAALKRK